MTDSEFFIRPAKTGDIPALEAIDQSVWTESTTPAGPYRGPTFGSVRSLDDVWVAQCGSSVVGFVLLGRRTPLDANRHVAALRSLAVLPSQEGQGIGSALVRRAIAEAALRGYRKLSLTVLGTNMRALRLYEREGFIVEGRMQQEFLLGGQWVDDLVLGRFLV